MRLKGKTVILGRGEVAETVASSLRAWDQRVTLISDPTRIEQLSIHKARRLVIVADGLVIDGLRNVREVVSRVGDLCQRRRRQAKPPLYVLLLTSELAWEKAAFALPKTEPACSTVMRHLSIPQRAARLLLSRFPLHASADVVFGQPLHILIAGFGALGQAIALQAMRLAHFGHGKPRFTILDADPQRCKLAFLTAFPQAGVVGDLQFLNLSVDVVYSSLVTSVFVCLDDNCEAAHYAERLRDTLRQHQGSSPPVYLHLSAFDGTASIDEWDGQTYPFSAVSEVSTPAILFDHQGDELAAVIHDYYRDSIAAQGRSLDETSAGRPWETLDESYRQASRHQADHVPGKLASIDCRSVPQDVSEFFVFNPLEVERLAMIEHDRWCADRFLDRWVYGPQRDNARKRHPELVPYDGLSTEMKNLDRYAVRLVPVLLARQGRAVKSNLLMAVSADASAPTPGSGFDNQIDAVLKRLCERFPDRFPVLAVNLSSAAERALARRALERFGAALQVLLSEPIQDTLQTLDSMACRRDYLDLLAHAECRTRLNSDQERRCWLIARPEVLIVISDRPAGNEERCAVTEMPVDTGGLKRRFAPRRVFVNPVTGETRWTFEY